jgi:hypothetical protein
VDCPTPAYEFRHAVAVAIADAPIGLAQNEAECDAWAGYAQFTKGLHAVTSLPRQPSMTAPTNGLPGQSRPAHSVVAGWAGEGNDR